MYFVDLALTSRATEFSVRFIPLFCFLLPLISSPPSPLPPSPLNTSLPLTNFLQPCLLLDPRSPPPSSYSAPFPLASFSSLNPPLHTSVADEQDDDPHDVVRSPREALQQLRNGLVLGRAAFLEVDGVEDERVGGEAARDREGPVAEERRDGGVPLVDGAGEGGVAIVLGGSCRHPT